MTASRPEIRGAFGAVASTHWLASSTGMAVLEQGGNAFDAAAAAGFVLQVVEPHSNGLGGDVVIALYERSTGTVEIVCGQGPMPGSATPAAFRDLGLTQIPGSGVLPACVPGAFGGWLRMLAEHGRMSLRSVLEPAIGYAVGGYPLLPNAARTIAAVAQLFRDEWTGSADTYLPGGVPPSAGSRMTNRTLGQTYARLLREAEAAGSDRLAQLDAARRAFYCGFVAEGIDEFLKKTPVMDATGRRHMGLLTADDLAAWLPSVEQPCSLAYRDYTIHKPGPWAQGPVFLQQLAILDGIDLRDMGVGGAEYVHTLAEAAKLAFADREAWYGDPRHTPVPMAQLLAPDYAVRRRALISDRAATDPQPGSVGERTAWIPRLTPESTSADDPEWMAHLRSGIPTAANVGAGAGNTCVVTAVDREGNLVAAVPSGGWLKSSPVIPALGFSLGTRGQTMWLVDGHPNSVAPGRRPRTTLSPGVILRDGEPFIALGTPGGDQQDQWTLEAFLAIAVFGLDLQSATELPAFHIDHFAQSFTPHTARPGCLVIERSYGEPVLAELGKRGHRVDAVPANTLGKVCVVGIDPVHRFVRAGAGPRGGQAYAVGR